MWRGFLFILLCVLPLTAWAQDWETHRDRLIADCKRLDECLEILDRTLPEQDDGSLGIQADKIAGILKERFGRTARGKLLEKALGDDEVWRRFAGHILSDWQGWTEEDIPALRKALRLERGSPIAVPLGEIGSPAAVEALIDNLPFYGAQGYTGAALIKLGPEKVMPNLLPVLALPFPWVVDGDNYYGRLAAIELISKFGQNAAFIAPEWVGIARSKSEPRERRLAALRGLRALGVHAAALQKSLHPLLDVEDTDIASETLDALADMHDPTVAAKFAATCPTDTNPYDGWADYRLSECLNRVAKFGSGGVGAGPVLVQRLGRTTNPKERAYLIEALGLIEFDPASRTIADFLDSRDWRVVWSAVRSLGWLRVKAALPGIRQIEAHHWLPELRDLASLVRISLETGKPFNEPPHGADRQARYFGNYNDLLPDTEKCASEEWIWNGISISFRNYPYPDGMNRLKLEDGELIGINRGEFGGSLEWTPRDGEPAVILKDNVIALLKTKRGPLVVGGLSHVTGSRGYVIALTRKADGSWTIREIARLTGAAYRIKRIGDDTFAAWTDEYSGGRVVIFTPNGIQGLAQCALN